jgi:Fe-S-cluster-containing hydrogenase component 2
MSELSDCCKAPVHVNTADEGTSCYVCNKCGVVCGLGSWVRTNERREQLLTDESILKAAEGMAQDQEATTRAAENIRHSMSNIDDILLKAYIEVCDEHYNEGDFDQDEEAHDWLKKSATKQALYTDMLELIGSDEPEDTEYEYYNKLHDYRNGLRQELRAKIKEYYKL